MPDGFYLRLASEMDPAANERLHALCGRLLEDLEPGVTDLLPGYVSLYVEYDRRITGERRLSAWLERHLENLEGLGAGRSIEIAVRYDGEDLPDLAERTGLSVEEVTRLHAAREYLVYAMGFAPGFPFMGEVAPELRTPRLAVPRKSVPAHSVGVAGAQTGIYPRSTAGGWRLLGRALEAVYDPQREEPFLLRPGDRVRFRAADHGVSPPEPAAVALLPDEPRFPTLKVLEPGLLDLIVDSGRTMVGRFGLVRSGPLDASAARLANALLANPLDAPLVEVSLKGPLLEAISPAVVAFAGRGLKVKVNGQAREAPGSFALQRGDLVSVESGDGDGCRGYLALEGGVEAKRYAGSASVDLKGLIGRPLVAGDVVGREREGGARSGFRFSPYRFERDPGSPRPLRIVPGPQATPEATEALTAGSSSGVFTVVAADRAGVRLEGGEVPGGEILSEAVPLGAIQVPPGGSPIILLNDRGTLGGYAKPALVHPRDLPEAGQLRVGDRVRFVKL